jgi:hypothetical protein
MFGMNQGRTQLTCPTCERSGEVSPRLAGKKLRCRGCGASLRVPGPRRLKSLRGRARGHGWTAFDIAVAAVVGLLLLGTLLWRPVLRNVAPERAVMAEIANWEAFALARYQSQDTLRGLPLPVDPWNRQFQWSDTRGVYSAGPNGYAEEGLADDVVLRAPQNTDRILGEAPTLLAATGLSLGLAFLVARRIPRLESLGHEAALVLGAGAIPPVASGLAAVALLRLPLDLRLELPFLAVPAPLAAAGGVVVLCLSGALLARRAVWIRVEASDKTVSEQVARAQPRRAEAWGASARRAG